MDGRTKRWGGPVALLLATTIACALAPSVASAAPHGRLPFLPGGRFGVGLQLPVVPAGSHAEGKGSQKLPGHGPDGVEFCNDWSFDSSPNANAINFLYGVDAVSSTDVWSVGTSFSLGQGDASANLAEHWNGSSWSVASIPSPNVGNRLLAVSTRTSSDAWAVGYQYATSNQPTTLAEHWNGTSWSVMSTPNPTNRSILGGVVAIAANDVWAVGSFSDAGGRYQTLIEHFDGSVWSVVTSPNPVSDNGLAGISAVSSTDIWAVGTQVDAGVTAEQPLAVHWDGSAWSVVATPSPASRAMLTAATAVAANDVWAVGVSADDIGRAFSEHWDGTSWTVVPIDQHGSSDTQFYGVAATAANDVWAAGFYYDAPNHTLMPLIEHWDGSTWTAESTGGRSGGNLLWGVTALPTGEAWVVGTSTADDSSQYYSLIESYESFRTCGTDLSITMTDSPDPMTADSNVTYSITVTNSGPDPARTAMVQDQLPSTAALVSVSPSQGTCSVANLQVTCDLGTINSGAQARVAIVATLIQPGSVANYAQTWGPYDPDPDPNDNDVVVSTTVRPQANTTYVQVTGSGFNPRLVTITPGTTVQWNFLQGTHTATDNTGMGLFGSGFRNSVDYFRFTFFAAGTYDVVDQVIPNNTSVVEVVTKASPKQGDPTTRFRIVWSTMFPPAGYAFDVEIRRPGSQGYVDYLVGTTLRNTNFVPDAGPGRYSFRAELRNTVNGAATRPSPSVTIRC